MRRISTSADRFEASRNEKITVTIEAKKTPHQVTFSTTGPVFTTEADPPPVELRSFTMGSADTDFSIIYTFPPPAQRDPAAHYLVTFAGKEGTSDGPNKIFPSALGNIKNQFCEFRVAVAAPSVVPPPPIALAANAVAPARKPAPAKKKKAVKKKVAAKRKAPAKKAGR